MTSKLSKSARRVQEYFSSNGFKFEITELNDSTRTAQEAADSVGCEVGQIAKSLVFVDELSDRPILIIASGANRVDVRKVGQLTGKKLGRADGKFVKKRVGFSIGGVPPAGHKETIETILDHDLKKYSNIWAAAGTPHAVFELNPTQLESLTNGEWMDVSQKD